MRPVFTKLFALCGLILSSGPQASPASDAAIHWSFVAPVRSRLPAVKNQRWVRNPIDAFVLARLEENGLTPSPEADRRTLLRRLSFDLLGLPPTPEQARDFLTDPSSDAYERLVDSLLASPHFGERWARHWLDLARYADTSGYQVDRPRPYAYLFRDWVIDAINRDLPFDQFTIEQLAGDLLPGATPEQKTAAGFHRLTLMNHEDGVDEEEFRCKAKVDRVSTTGTVWLGLTLGCAECHNHKYDPISQREFYQLYAFFNNADEVDEPVSPTKGVDARALSFRESTNSARAWIHIRGDFLRKGEEVGPGTPAVLPSLNPRDKPGRAACLPVDNPLTRPSATLSSSEGERDGPSPRRSGFGRAGGVRGWFKGISPASPESRQEAVPGVTNSPEAKPGASRWPGGPSPDRLDLARWIVAPENPLTARVAVNHVWQHLFGRGLVGTPEDFGTRGERPSHPELLDWLAVAFMTTAGCDATSPMDPLPMDHPLTPSLSPSEGTAIESSDKTNFASSPSPREERAGRGSGLRRAEAASAAQAGRGEFKQGRPPLPGPLLLRASGGEGELPASFALGWSRKALIKLIVTSATYRQSSHFPAELQERDPQNLLLARQNRFRLESEIIRDVYLAAGNLLNDALGGPSFRPYMPEDVKKLGSAGAFSWTDSEGPEKYRRGLYIFAQRTVPYPTAMTFDQADPTQSCPRRERSNTPLQALTLLNHGLFVECAQGLANRMMNAPLKETGERIRYGFELCLGRQPTREERTRLERLYDEQLRLARRSPAAGAQLAGKSDSARKSPAETASLVALGQVLLNLDEFLTRE